MITFRLLFYSMISGLIYLIIIDTIWHKLEDKVPVLVNFPKELIDTGNLSWFISNLIIEFIFFVMMPTVIYDWFYTVLPFWGIRGGIAVALYVFMLGMVPFAILIIFRIKIPALFVLFYLAGLLVKVLGCMAIIGFLYSL